MECDPNRPVSKSELNQLEQHLDRVWDALDVDIVFTRHFFDRLNDPRNVKQITVCELQRIFRDTFRDHGKTIVNLAKKRRDLDGVIRSATTNINTPFVLQWTGDEFELVAKTIMRKRRFMVPGGQKQFKVENEMGPFEKMVEKSFEESQEPLEELAPPIAKRAGFNYIIVPDRSRYPTYDPRGFADREEAYMHGDEHFPRGYTLMTLAEYTRAWRKGLINPLS